MVLGDAISGAVEGAISTGIKLGIEGVKRLIQKFKDRKIIFVQDTETLNQVKEELKSSELKFYKSYVEDGNLISPMLMGLTLRRLEEKDDLERIEHLRGKILSKFDTDGVHIAHAVQSGIVSRYITYLLEIHSSANIMKKRLLEFLKNIEDYIHFVNALYFDLKKDKEKIFSRININSPEVFVISGMGSTVKDTEELIKEIDKLDLKEYYREDYSRKNRRIAFFYRVISKL